MKQVTAITRKQLTTTAPRDYEHGDKLRIGKYIIFIKQGNWGKNVETYAESDDNPMMPLGYGKMPRYIREFIFNA